MRSRRHGRLRVVGCYICDGVGLAPDLLRPTGVSRLESGQHMLPAEPHLQLPLAYRHCADLVLALSVLFLLPQSLKSALSFLFSTCSPLHPQNHFALITQVLNMQMGYLNNPLPNTKQTFDTL